MTLSGRVDRIRDIMRERNWDLLVCALPMNVLMLSGYWPMIGTGVVCVDREGRIRILVPQDEEELARKGWSNDVTTFQPGSLDSLDSASQTLERPLAQLVRGKPSQIGYEGGEASEPSSYAAMNLYNGSMAAMLKAAFPGAALQAADDALAVLRAVKTEDEIERIRGACKTAAAAFEAGLTQLQPGIQEIHAALNFRQPLSESTAERADGYVSCMSGANSGHAFGAFARSTHKVIEAGDLVLTHCNSYEDGYWTDITRTYVTGQRSQRHRDMYSAIQAAHQAAIAVIKPGVAASEVDRAARETVTERGFGSQFKHSTGHGVGFEAIDAHALPRIHPKSPDVLEVGMVFNVEPGIYFPGHGGMRHCDMIVVTESGSELLTLFQPVEVSA